LGRENTSRHAAVPAGFGLWKDWYGAFSCKDRDQLWEGIELDNKLLVQYCGGFRGLAVYVSRLSPLRLSVNPDASDEESKV
jgi:hypothetical protein